MVYFICIGQTQTFPMQFAPQIVKNKLFFNNPLYITVVEVRAATNLGSPALIVSDPVQISQIRDRGPTSASHFPSQIWEALVVSDPVRFPDRYR